MDKLDLRDNRQRLEDALLEFVEKETREPSSEAALRILPEMAHTLVMLWNINRP